MFGSEISTFFKDNKTSRDKLINQTASLVFGIYLIHDNPYMRDYLWGKAVQVGKFLNSLFLVPYSLFVIMIICLVCGLVEFIRGKTIEKAYVSLVKKISEGFENMIDHCISCFL